MNASMNLPSSPQVATIHRFSRTFARQYGLNAAILAGYLANRLTCTHKLPDQGFRCKLDDLSPHYPYLSRTAINNALLRMIKRGVLKAHHRNYNAIDRTRHYYFATPALQTEASMDPIYFNVDEAILYGVPAALVLTNLRMRIQERVKRDPAMNVYRVSARKLEKYLPLKHSTITRALNALHEDGVIQMQRCAGFDRAYGVTVASLVDAASGDSRGSNQDPCAPLENVHEAAENPHDASEHHNRQLEVNIESERSKSDVGSKNRYEGRPAAPSASGACFQAAAGGMDPSRDGHACGDATAQDQVGILGTTAGVPSGDPAGAATLTTTPPVSGHVSLIDEHGGCDPFEKPFLDPRYPAVMERVPIPKDLQQVREANEKLYNYLTEVQETAPYYAAHKIDAFIRHHGAAKIFRWLAIKSDDEVFRLISEGLEKFKHTKSDFGMEGGRLGVDWFCADWFVQACREYLSDNLNDHKDYLGSMVGAFADHFVPYRRDHLAELEKEGLAYLRYGEEVRLDRLRSPDEDRETFTDITGAEKVKVLVNGMLAINRVGVPNTRGGTRHNAVTITKRGLKLARRFFELNPNWSAGNLLAIIHNCVERIHNWGVYVGGFREDFSLTRGNHLTYLIRHLERIIDEMGYGEFIPPAQFFSEEILKEAA